MRHAVLFGGAGFIGTHLAQDLARRGVRVTIADLDLPTARSELVSYVHCDVREPICFNLEDVDLVLNLAAVHRTPGHRDHEYYDTNVAGALNVTEWASAQRAPTVCFTSSISVYGPTEAPKDEWSPLTPTSAYGRSKLLAEVVHRRWLNADPSRRLVVVRPAVVFGPGERGNFTRLARALARRRFVYPGRDDVVKACGHVYDLVRAIRFALGSKERELTFNYAYPRGYTIRDICRAFHDVAGYPLPPTAPPLAVAGVLRLLQILPVSSNSALSPDRVRKLTASTHVVPRRLMNLGFAWETDLTSGLHAWRDAEPTGLFQ